MTEDGETRFENLGGANFALQERRKHIFLNIENDGDITSILCIAREEKVKPI